MVIDVGDARGVLFPKELLQFFLIEWRSLSDRAHNRSQKAEQHGSRPHSELRTLSTRSTGTTDRVSKLLTAVYTSVDLASTVYTVLATVPSRNM